MSLLIFKVSDYETTHERELFDTISEKLKKEFDEKEDIHILIANPTLGNRDLDALFIKRDAIIVIEFKNYEGRLESAENGDWKCDEIVVKGGSGGKNPYTQVKLNKTGVCSFLNQWYYKPNVNVSHISGIVLFAKPIEIITANFSPQVLTWFHITDINKIESKLKNITSREINYSNKDLLELSKKLNLDSCLEYQTEINTVPKVLLDSTLVPLKNTFTKNSLDTIKANIEEIGFTIIDHSSSSAREGRIKKIDKLYLSTKASAYLKNKVNGNVWEHQFDAIEKFLDKKNICITTSTSSGKSLVFYSCGIDLITKNPDAKIIAIYPLRALANQQEENWKNAALLAGLNIKIGKIDGTVEGLKRNEILINSNIIIFTPDVIHTFLLGKLNDKKYKEPLINFLSKTKLVIVDEIHTYKGVFGSNSAYLFRRLNHTVFSLNNSIPQYISASATIEEPEKHLDSITGLPFEIIDNDASPEKSKDILMIEAKNSNQLLNKLTELIKYFVLNTDKKGITFLDSRKMVDQVSGIVNRIINKEEIQNDIEDEENILKIKNYVYPYRSGYEQQDSEEIQSKLQNGSLRNIISTSALEMGMDISSIDLGILLGLPYSSTSFYQRIGRVGRVGCKSDGLIIIINDNSVRSQTVFDNPAIIRNSNLPVAESALYLENENLQNIHALCFAEFGGEYDMTSTGTETFHTQVNFPLSFIEKCKAIRSHIKSKEYIDICDGVERGYPQYSYPIRDLEPQFKVKTTRGLQKGNLSLSQVMREAYPGAIYHYIGESFRVCKVNLKDRSVEVRSERQYTTKPILFTAVYPQLIDSGIFSATSYDDLKICELELMVNEKITGLMEKRGGAKEERINYPIYKPNEYLNYSKSDFSRSYRTSGTILSHPSLNDPNVKVSSIAKIIYEIFLLKIPFEPQDIDYSNNRFQRNTMGFDTDERFIVIYDKSKGSLRLTNRLTEHTELKKVFTLALELINNTDNPFSFVDNEKLNQETINAIAKISEALKSEGQNIRQDGNNKRSVLKPNSVGMYENNRVTISKVADRNSILSYQITIGINGGEHKKWVAINEVQEIQNESEWGNFNFDEMEVE